MFKKNNGRKRRKLNMNKHKVRVTTSPYSLDSTIHAHYPWTHNVDKIWGTEHIPAVEDNTLLSEYKYGNWT